MSESLELFETILQYPWFTKQNIILFLNKTDLFETKMPKSNLTDYFPTYMGSNTEIEEVINLTLLILKRIRITTYKVIIAILQLLARHSSSIEYCIPQLTTFPTSSLFTPSPYTQQAHLSIVAKNDGSK